MPTIAVRRFSIGDTGIDPDRLPSVLHQQERARRAPIEQMLKPAGLDWITALRAPAIRQLAADDGPLQLSLFESRDMAEIRSPDYPGERLVVCKNPLLAEERRYHRADLLAATEKDLVRIQQRVERSKNPLRGRAPRAPPQPPRRRPARRLD